MGYVVYQRTGRLENGTLWKYIGVTCNLKRRLGEHARDYRQPIAHYLDNSTSVKTTILERKRGKPAAYAAELSRIHKTAYRARTTVVVNINGTK